MKIKAIAAFAIFGLTLEFSCYSQVLWDFSGNWGIELVGETSPVGGYIQFPPLVIINVSEKSCPSLFNFST